MLKFLQRYHSKTERLRYQAIMFWVLHHSGATGFTFLPNFNGTGNKTFAVFLVNKVTSGLLQARCVQTILNMAVICSQRVKPEYDFHDRSFISSKGSKEATERVKPTLEGAQTEILRKRFPSTLLNEKKALVCCVVKAWCVARSGGALILLQRPVPESCSLNSCLGNKGHAVTWA